MRSLLLASTLLLAGGSALAANDAATGHTFDSTWRVEIDASGKVTALEQETKVKPTLADPIEKAISKWTFDPGRVDGQPVATETTLYLTTLLEARDEGYAIRVESASTGGARDHMVAPTFPQAILRRVAGRPYAGLAVVLVTYDANGKVLTAEPVADVPQSDRALGRSAANAIKRWTFRPEMVGGHGVAASVYVPVCYQLEGSVTAMPSCPQWSPPDSHRSVDAAAGLVSLDPAAKLRDDVIGKML
ncbi:MAG: TonB family protein [Xanthomonadales bacterium]|nr:TonB family protein [Xanthomonadales bacterium]